MFDALVQNPSGTCPKKKRVIWERLKNELGRCAVDVPINIETSKLTYYPNSVVLCTIGLNQTITPFATEYITRMVHTVVPQCIVMYVVGSN